MADISYKELPEFFLDMIPQESVKSYVLPKGIPQNSIWDFIRTPEGRFFLSVCAEGDKSASGQFYEFYPDNGSFRHCFDLSKVCMVGARAIPPSKIHTSMDIMPDGRIIMATHNTAPAPGHPYWMFDAYYSHIWEGFAGSHLLVYNPQNDDVHCLGIPVPHESIYGGIYDEKRNVYYAIGYGRGHLYRYELATGNTIDMGQVSEFGSYRLTRGPDRNIYGSTRTGWVYRIDVDRQEVIDLGVQFPTRPDYPARRQYVSGTIGSDGRLYMSNHVCDILSALDVRTNKLEILGSCDPGPIVKKNYPRCATGLTFDKEGVLWYNLVSVVAGGIGGWSHLCKWDITRHGKPELVGLLGSLDRAVSYVSEIIYDKNKLYVSDTNHSYDPPAVHVVDLDALKRAGKACEKPNDINSYTLFSDGDKIYPGNPEDVRTIQKEFEKWETATDFYNKNTYTIQAEEAVVARIWHKAPVAESSVRKIRWNDNKKLQGICGNSKLRAFECDIDGGLVILDESEINFVNQNIPEPSGLALISEPIKGVVLPHRQGRQYLAVASCCAPWKNGQFLVGTRDGILALVDTQKKTVFSLGAVAPNGPVHQIAVNKTGTVAFGVAGDEWDLGHCFYYDDENGVRELGRTFTFEFTAKPGLANSCQPCCVALSPDESWLAIGVADRLGTVYMYRNLFSKRS